MTDGAPVLKLVPKRRGEAIKALALTVPVSAVAVPAGLLLGGLFAVMFATMLACACVAGAGAMLVFGPWVVYSAIRDAL